MPDYFSKFILVDLCFCQRARRPGSLQRHAGSCRPPRLLRRLAGYQEQVETRHRQARPQPDLREKACLDDKKTLMFLLLQM